MVWTAGKIKRANSSDNVCLVHPFAPRVFRYISADVRWPFMKLISQFQMPGYDKLGIIAIRRLL